VVHVVVSIRTARNAIEMQRPFLEARSHSWHRFPGVYSAATPTGTGSFEPTATPVGALDKPGGAPGGFNCHVGARASQVG
jgi:hypothetical protein